MQFLKKNYEKIVLAVVVLVTLGAVAFLPIMVSQEKQKLDDLEHQASPPPKPLAEVDLSQYDKYAQRAKTTVSLNLADPHKVFNPVRFQLKPGNVVFRNPAGQEVNNLEVTKITPLLETYSFAGASASPGLPTHYGIGVKHEAAAQVSGRNVKITYAEMNKATNNFTVIAAEGPEDDPTSVKLRLTDSGATVTITKDKPYSRPEAYMADLIYTPEKKPFLNRRKTDSSTICFAGECYKIVDITESEVVLLQLSNQKTWIRPYNQTNPSTSTAPQPQL